MFTKRALLAAALLACTAAAQAQQKDPNAILKNYAAKMLPRCPGGTLTIEPMAAGPRNFSAFTVTQRSTDQYCGSQKYLLYSPTTQQILLGSVIPLPNDGRPVNVRIAAESSRLLNQPLTANVAPFPLPDGIHAVNIVRQTPFGSFAYKGFVDASQQFLIIASRGSLKTDPATSIREALGVTNAMRRGNSKSNVEILELSDFQCPTCARAHQNIEPIIKKNLSKINYARLDLPLFEHHDWSVPAAMGARALQRVAPKVYWDYVDFIFSNQDKITSANVEKMIKDFCEDHDVDWNAMNKIYGSKAERQALLEQVSSAFGIGVASTPTYIVNGQIMGFGPEGGFTLEAIQTAIAGAKASSAPAKSTPAKKKATSKSK
ncbi:MAG TPA: thioredoxin domain-containing protein [Thermoanaerobaculia bacterium]|jgi:protein-disulfide isomerase